MFLEQTLTHDPRVLAHYEGLVFRTAQILREPTKHGPAVQIEQEDIEQILRIKIWQAIVAYDPAKSRMPLDRYVFMCVTSKSIDLRNRHKRLREDYIDDVATSEGRGGSAHGEDLRDWFDSRYLATTHEQVFGEIEEGQVLIPSTLEATERAIVVGLYAGWKQTEIADRLHLEKREIEKAMRSIRLKFADWSPGLDESAPQLDLVAA